MQQNGYRKISKCIEKLKGLKHISIRNCILTAAILAKLINNNKDIKHLNLNSCNISDWEMFHIDDILQDVCSLRYLDLSHISDPKVTEHISKIIINNTNLKYLKLAACKLNDSNIKTIINAMRVCKNLVLLNLTDNNVGSLDYKGFNNMITCNNNIRYLLLANCSLQDQKIEIICNQCSSLKLLDLRFNNNCSPLRRERLADFIIRIKLQEVLLPMAKYKLMTLYNGLENAKFIRYLDCGFNIFEVTDEDANKILTIIIDSRYFASLEQLNFSKLVICNDDLTRLNNGKLNIRSINYLSITKCVFNNHTWKFLKHLIRKNKVSITELTLIDCVIPESIADVITCCASNLRCLKLNNNKLMKEVHEMAAAESNAQLYNAECRLVDNGDKFDFRCYQKKLVLLDLSDICFMDKTMECLFINLDGFTTLECLKLANCGLTAKEMKYITRLHFSHINLKHIDLSCNMITDEAAVPVAFMIYSSKQLQHLNLSNCKFQSCGIAFIIEVLLEANASLKHLDLSLNGKVDFTCHNIMMDTSAIKILEQIMNILKNSKIQHIKLPEIILSKQHIIMQQLLKTIANNFSIKYIDLGPNKVNKELTDDVHSVLIERKQLSLTTLELKDKFYMFQDSFDRCPQVGLRGLLHLSINCINDIYAPAIVNIIYKNRLLQTFDLSDCTFKTHYDIRPSCNCYDVCDCDRREECEGSETITYALKVLSLEYLLLNNFCIGKMNVSEAIQCNSKLKHIELAGCSIDEAQCSHILNAINHCKDVAFLNLSHNVCIGKISFVSPGFFLNNKELTHIDVTACEFTYKSISEFCEVLHNCVELKYLNLSHNSNVGQVVNQIISLLLVLIKLEYLNLHNCNLQTTSIKRIAARLKEFSTLRYVYLSLNKMTHEAINDLAAILTNNKNLKKFALPEFDQSYLGIKILTKSMKTVSSLKYVDISSAQVCTDTVMELGIKVNSDTDLHQVLLTQPELDTKSLSELGGNLELRQLTTAVNAIYDEDAGNMTMVIANNPSMEKLNLSSCKVSLQRTLHVLQVLTSSISLISCNNTDITGQLENDLALVLSEIATLRHLWIENCLSEFGMSKIIATLEANNEITHLKLNGSKVSERNLMHLANTMKENKIEQLELSGCNITKIDIVLKFLSSKTLKYLDLSYNIISSEMDISKQHEVIKSSCSFPISLQSLNLSNCMLQHKQLDQIMRQLKHINSLLYLNISGNNLSGNITVKLIEVIAINTDIQYLHFSNCNLAHSEVAYLLNTINQRKCVKQIDISLNETNYTITEELINVVRSNKCLEFIMLSKLEIHGCQLDWLSEQLPLMRKLDNLSIIGSRVCRSINVRGNLVTLISNNKTFKYLDVSNCEMRARDINDIFAAMKNVSSLTHLILKNIPFVDETYDHVKIDVISAVIANNTGLQHINITGCKNEDFIRSIPVLISNHKHIIFKQVS